MNRAKSTLDDLRQFDTQIIRDVERISSQIQFVINTALSRPKANLVIRPRAALTWQMAETVAQRAIVLQRIFSQGMADVRLFAFCPLISIFEGPVSTFTFLFEPPPPPPPHFPSAPRWDWHEASVQISPVTDQALGSESQPNERKSQVVRLEGSSPDQGQDSSGDKPEAFWVNSPQELCQLFQNGSLPYLTANVCLKDAQSESVVMVTTRSRDNLLTVRLKDLLYVQGGIRRLAKLALAVELSRAVFMLQGTGIISENIKSGNVFLAMEDSKIRLRNLLLPATVTNKQRTEDHTLQEENPSKSVTSFGRASMTLGILLVKVLLARDILPDDDLNDVSSYERRPEVLRALEEIRFEFGQSTSDAVRQCLCGISCISNIQAQRKAFSDFVLLPLENDLQYLEPERPGRNAEIILPSYWYHVIGASKYPAFPAFPVALAEDISQISLRVNPGLLPVVKGYLQEMQASCADIAWLDEAVSEQVRQFEKVLIQFEGPTPPIPWYNGSVSRATTLIKRCSRVISTIPEIYYLDARSAERRRALEDLQIQLHLGLLELASLLAQPEFPSSLALSSAASVADESSVFDNDSFTLSARTSIAENLCPETRFLDSKALAQEILRALSDVIHTGNSTAGRQPVNEAGLASELREILGKYLASLQHIDQKEQSSADTMLSPIYQKAHTLVCRETEFLLQQLISMCRDQSYSGMIRHHSESTTIPDIPAVETVPEPLALNFLLGGRAFGRMRLHLHRLVRKDMIDIIREEVLRNLPLTTLGLYTTAFNVRWDVAEFIMNEFDKTTEIGQILTITGGSSYAYAARCADYLNWLWKDSKYDIHTLVQHYLKQHIYVHADSTLVINKLPDGQPGIRATVIGGKETIIELAQQLAWLTAALRSSTTGAVLSEVDFFAIKETEFFIEPGSLLTLSQTITEKGPCWHGLVRNVSIANGFPIPPRSGQVGLELPLATMLTLSRAKTFVMSNKRVALYGFSSFLFPTDFYDPEHADGQPESEQSIQWHFETTSKPGQYFDCANYLAESRCTWSDSVDERTITMSRHFIGYCRVAEFRLATSTSDFTNLQQSSLPDASTPMGVRIEAITAGTSGLGFATAEAQGTIKYPRSIFTLASPDEYLGTMDTLQRMSMILWDSSDQCGWLVPAQALLLHMAHLWVYRKNITPTFRYADPSHPSYLEQVNDILRTDRRKVLEPSGRDDDTDRELRHLIMRFWNDLRACMIAQQSAVRDGQGVIGAKSQALSGWELMDFIFRPPFLFSMKQDMSGPSDNSWRALAVQKNIPVLFCKGAGDVITSPGSGFLCAHCNISLRKGSYLIASLASLKQMSEQFGGFRTQTQFTADWGWKPIEEAALFAQHCRAQSGLGISCHERIQKLSAFRNWHGGSNLSLPIEGAVVFGRPGSRFSHLILSGAGQSPSNTAMVKQGTLKRLTQKLARLSPRS
ncbi:hypothetical protein ASPCAL07516 [Aspergillus calidoustus]|uniref:Uncharacterized protein n=1 Tax=Aspergillus calidoustus TaxID=454130 RepID=A0A0U5G3W5_ASPCI|nr:hypothetical protein ASPCAL07516 [Aspergillus calidoustus]